MADEKDGMALRVRPPAFGLPTGCPRSLSTYFYLRLANVSFRIVYSGNLADSDDIPLLESGRRAGFASEGGGVEEFLREEHICDLDVNMSQLEKADMEAFKSLLVPLQDALDYEIWCFENEMVAETVYVSQVPWPVSKAITWDMRRKVMARLGFTKENVEFRKAEIYKRAFDAYRDLEDKKQSDPFLLRETPTSLDAGFLAHLLFVVNVPLQESSLKDELQKKHPQLIRYVNGLRDKLLKSGPMYPDLPSSPPPPPPPPVSSQTSSTRASSSKSSNNKGDTKRKHSPTPSEKDFQKKSKLFLIAQLVALLGYVLFTSIEFEDDD